MFAQAIILDEVDPASEAGLIYSDSKIFKALLEVFFVTWALVFASFCWQSFGEVDNTKSFHCRKEDALIPKGVLRLVTCTNDYKTLMQASFSLNCIGCVGLRCTSGIVYSGSKPYPASSRST